MSIVKSTVQPITATRPQTLGDFKSRLSALAERKSRCLLLDLSGSMGYHEVDQLKKIVGNFPNERKFQFSSSCHESTSLPSSGAGGTNLAAAFNHIKSQGLKHCILVTDGRPDSMEAAETAAVGLKIDCFYVGADWDDEAKNFLRRLAEGHSGSFGSASIDEVQLLTSGIAGLLAAGK